MAIFQNPFNRKAKKSTGEIEIRPTFIPLEWLNAYLADGLNANQRKFLELYLQVPELQAIINYKARVFAGMRVVPTDNDGNILNKQDVQPFAEPNPLQNFKEFAAQYYTLRAIFGNAFIHPVYGKDRTQTKAFWNLPALNAEVIPTKSTMIPFNATEKEELISGFRFWYKGQAINYEPDEIIHFNDNQVQFDSDKILLGDSKIRPLVQACENIKTAYEARGILIANSALGILSNETTDGAGTVELDPKEKEQLQEDYREKYGLQKHKWQFIITNAALRWQSMAVNTSNLRLFEEVDADFRAIANAHSFPPEILQTNSTYENKEKAISQLYNEAIIPEANEWLQGIANWMRLPFKLKADYNHVAALQIDKERASKAVNWAATGLGRAVEAGLITPEDAQEEFKKFLS
jgi:phage portal protein BeeE